MYMYKRIILVGFVLTLLASFSSSADAEEEIVSASWVKIFEGLSCPDNYQVLSYHDAQNLIGDLCDTKLPDWSLVRIADNGDLVGSYHNYYNGCRVDAESQYQHHEVGQIACVVPPSKAEYDTVPASMLPRISLVKGSLQCPDGQRKVTYSEAEDLHNEICATKFGDSWENQWVVASLANDGELTGRGYNCEVFSHGKFSSGDSLCFDEPKLSLEETSRNFTSTDNPRNMYFYVPKQSSVLWADEDTDARSRWHGHYYNKVEDCSLIATRVYDKYNVEHRAFLCGIKVSNGKQTQMNNGYNREKSSAHLRVEFRAELNTHLPAAEYTNPDGLLVHIMDWSSRGYKYEAALKTVVYVDIGTISVEADESDEKRLMAAGFEISRETSGQSQCLQMTNTLFPGNEAIYIGGYGECDSSDERTQWFYDYNGRMFVYYQGERYCLRGNSFIASELVHPEECQIDDEHFDLIHYFTEAEDGTKNLFINSIDSVIRE